MLDQNTNSQSAPSDWAARRKQARKDWLISMGLSVAFGVGLIVFLWYQDRQSRSKASDFQGSKRHTFRRDEHESEPRARDVELRQAVDGGLVRLSAFGSGLESVYLSAESNSDQSLRVTIRAGTVFRARSGRKQNMVARATRSFMLRQRAQIQVDIEAACINMHKDTPTATDELVLETSERSDDLEKLMNSPQFQAVSFRIQQFAVWTITDNPTRYDFVGIVGADQPNGDGSPGTNELQQIRLLFERAAISTWKYRAFGG